MRRFRRGWSVVGIPVLVMALTAGPVAAQAPAGSRSAPAAAMPAAATPAAATPADAALPDAASRADDPAAAADDRALLERHWRAETGMPSPTAGLAPAEDAGSGRGTFRANGLAARRALSGSAAVLRSLAGRGGVLDADLLADARPDACFAGIGVPAPGTPPCGDAQPKVNQAYVWGLTRSGEQLWFGTGANVLCLVVGGFLGRTTPTLTDAWVCEYGAAGQQGLPPVLGDWRPPEIYRYDLASDQLVDARAGAGATFGPEDVARLRSTLGIRAAGSTDDVVLLAGPRLAQDGVNLFAFTPDGSFLGSSTSTAYDNIRKFLRVGDTLYTGVSNVDGGGSVLRWTGDAADPFAFDVVGSVDGQASELAVHDGRMYVATWPSPDLSTPDASPEDLLGDLAGLWESPELGDDGLGTDAAADWRKVWQVDDYEVDPVAAATYGGGALHSYGGHLYWGTMHVPLLSTVAHLRVYGEPADTNAALAAVLGTWRSISIFRAEGFDEDSEPELLYGAGTLPVYRPDEGWQLVPNRTGAPRYGASGFGNPFNNYTWTMGVTDDRLFVGTMDHSFVLAEQLPEILQRNGIAVPDGLEIPAPMAGADLWRFDSADARARPETTDGLGNPANYGIRTMVADDDVLHVGTANPMNLLTGEQGPSGGWELWQLEPGG